MNNLVHIIVQYTIFYHRNRRSHKIFITLYNEYERMRIMWCNEYDGLYLVWILYSLYNKLPLVAIHVLGGRTSSKVRYF